MDTIELPKELQDAQDKITNFYKSENLKQLIGKYYSTHSGYGYPTSLRRIYLDNHDEIRVDEYHQPKETQEFKFDSYVITSSDGLRRYSHNWSELQSNVWHDCVKRMLNMKSISMFFEGKVTMLKSSLVTELKKLHTVDGDIEKDHIKADDLLLEFIYDSEISRAYNAVKKAYS